MKGKDLETLKRIYRPNPDYKSADEIPDAKIIIHVGAEGGSRKLYGFRQQSKWKFFMEKNVSLSG